MELECGWRHAQKRWAENLEDFEKDSVDFHVVEKLGSDHDVEKLGFVHGVEKLDPEMCRALEYC